MYVEGARERSACSEICMCLYIDIVCICEWMGGYERAFPGDCGLRTKCLCYCPYVCTEFLDTIVRSESKPLAG